MDDSAPSLFPHIQRLLKLSVLLSRHRIADSGLRHLAHHPACPDPVPGLQILPQVHSPAFIIHPSDRFTSSCSNSSSAALASMLVLRGGRSIFFLDQPFAQVLTM